jgi:hypothetical protein
MLQAVFPQARTGKSSLDRALSPFTDLGAGGGATPMNTARRAIDTFFVWAAAALIIFAVATPAFAQSGREAELARQQAEKARQLHPYVANPLERRIETVDSALAAFSKDGLYPFVGSTFAGSTVGIGAGYRGAFRDTGWFDAHGAWSFNNYKAVDAAVTLPAFAGRRVSVALHGNRTDPPTVAF